MVTIFPLTFYLLIKFFGKEFDDYAENNPKVPLAIIAFFHFTNDHFFKLLILFFSLYALQDYGIISAFFANLLSIFILIFLAWWAYSDEKSETKKLIRKKYSESKKNLEKIDVKPFYKKWEFYIWAIIFILLVIFVKG